jgi:hypothetical protein
MHSTSTGQSWTAVLTDKRIWTVSRSRCAAEQGPVCAAGVRDGVRYELCQSQHCTPSLLSVGWGGGSVQASFHCKSYQSDYRPAVMQRRWWPKPWHSWKKWPSVNCIRWCQILCCYRVGRLGLLNEHRPRQSVGMQRNKLGAIANLDAEFSNNRPLTFNIVFRIYILKCKQFVVYIEVFMFLGTNRCCTHLLLVMIQYVKCRAGFLCWFRTVCNDTHCWQLACYCTNRL